MILDCNGRPLDLKQTQVMGILNVTPDSFSDGGRYANLDAAIQQATQMASDGAAIIDVGGESTRPGAPAVSEQEELDRVIPVIEAIQKEIDLPISIDTSKAVVMQHAVAAGAGFINDVCALKQDNAFETAVNMGVPICIMHMQGTPRNMQENPSYGNVTTDIGNNLGEIAQKLLTSGVKKEHIIIDPGFGFGKTLDHNLELFANLETLNKLGHTVLVGVSRKSMIGQTLDLPVEERLIGSIALASLASWLNTKIIRAHDVKETVQAVRMVNAVANYKYTNKN